MTRAPISRRTALALVAGGAVAAPAAASGGAASGGPQWGPLDPAVAAAFSKEIERDLASRGARVALVFRAGRPAEDMPDGLRYTHGAFWVYSTIATDDGRTLRGYAVYNLYSGADGDPLRSFLKQDWPLDFTAPMAVADAGVIVPTLEMQRRIHGVIRSPTYAALHQPAYSLISNPHDPRYQNCNEFMMDVVAAAAWETSDRAQIKANLAAYFTPSEIDTNPIQRLFAPLADGRLKTADHDGAIRTATFASMAAFMESYALSDAVFTLQHSG